MAVHVMKDTPANMEVLHFQDIVREFALQSAPSFGELLRVTQVVYT